MELKGKKIGIAVTGSFCTLEAVLEQARRMTMAGAELYPVFSVNVQTMDTRFGRASYWREAFEGICGNPVIKTIAEAEPIGPGGLLDCVVIAPCSGNTLGKLALGITDGPVLMAAKAQLRSNKPVVVAIATNDGLGKSAVNIAAILNSRNLYLVPFTQDDPAGKPNSLIARMELLGRTVELALEQKQLQPVLAAAASDGDHSATDV